MNFFSIDETSKDLLKSAVVDKMSQDSTGQQVKTMIYIIIFLIILSYCALCMYNGYDIGKIFNTFNINLVSSINCLTIIIVILAMIYGFHTVSRDPSTLTKYLPNQSSYSAPMPITTGYAVNPMASSMTSPGSVFNSLASTPNPFYPGQGR